MPRSARVVVPGVPHHVTQRGNRRQETFFCEGDYVMYRSILSDWCRREGVEIWAYCLMPNHVHLITVPSSEQSLCRAVGEIHRRYSSHVNEREQWQGHLWQGRFSSVPMGESHLMAAARYIERNPVRAKLVSRAEDWPWSSAAAHVRRQDDIVVRVQPLLDRTAGWVCTWQDWLCDDADDAIVPQLRTHERSGLPIGDDSFISRLEAQLGRPLRPSKRGRPEKTGAPYDLLE